MDLKTAKVIVTGGSSGIGYETAKLLRFHGAKVVICGRTEDTLQQAAQELDAFGIQTDVSNRGGRAKIIRLCFGKTRRIKRLN